MKFTMVTDTAAKIQLTQAQVQALTVREDPKGPRPGRALVRSFKASEGSCITHNGNILLPIGGGWFWLSCTGGASADLERDLLSIEAGEFARKR